MEPDAPPRKPEKALLIVNDLFFEAKIGEVLRALGVPYAVAKSEDGLVKRLEEIAPALVFLDLGAKGIEPARAVERLRAGVPPGAPAPRIVAFAAHADPAEVARGRTIGAEDVLARGGLARALPEIVRRHAGRLASVEGRP
jgi:CheY-like chemotaxis protein